jgi:hypothetical protein
VSTISERMTYDVVPRTNGGTLVGLLALSGMLWGLAIAVAEGSFSSTLFVLILALLLVFLMLPTRMKPSDSRLGRTEPRGTALLVYGVFSGLGFVASGVMMTVESWPVAALIAALFTLGTIAYAAFSARRGRPPAT